MTGRQLLEELLKMDPANLEREIAIKYWEDGQPAQTIRDNITLGLETATARELHHPGMSRYKTIPVITLS